MRPKCISVLSTSNETIVNWFLQMNLPSFRFRSNFILGNSLFSDSALSLSTRKRKSDTSEPISESWSRTEQYKVNANTFSCCPHFVFARIFCDVNCYFVFRFVAVISGPSMISCGGRLAQRSEIRSARRFSRFR